MLKNEKNYPICNKYVVIVVKKFKKNQLNDVNLKISWI